MWFLWMGCGLYTKKQIYCFYLVILAFPPAKKMTHLQIAFLPPKKKAKKRDLQKRYFFKMTPKYIIIYYYYYYIITQHFALICDFGFRVIASSHGIFLVCNTKALSTRSPLLCNIPPATQRHHPTTSPNLTTTHRSYYHYHHSVTAPLSYSVP